MSKEIFFNVTNSELGKDYFRFLDDTKKINDYYIEFSKENDIEAQNYGMYPGDGDLYIEPTEKDLEKYNKVLVKGYGLRRFKGNSKIQKLWKNGLEQLDIKFYAKPSLFKYMGFLGTYSTRLFHHNKNVYLSIEGDIIDKDFPCGFEEIKGSEFYKVIEEIKSLNN